MRLEARGFECPKQRTIFKMRMEERSVEAKRSKSVGIEVEMSVYRRPSNLRVLEEM